MKNKFANTFDEHDFIDFIQNSIYLPTQIGDN